ncbi:uncharacterized protein LOC62_07G009675 [Vanrija pseudolonga]|uniref:Uncharacterized protein n=1 Tax=Vanrija pseudolonga TaxID=143232 RepID=A0AAF1BRS1_9TREE|nr:hypothetical protein LOC62_07G009675 [Vanrija pseudolonga]
MSSSTPTRGSQHRPSPGPSKPSLAEPPFSPLPGDDTMISADADALDFSSSDDEAGVFFGAHLPVERKIIAALSRSVPSVPAVESARSAPRRSSLAARVKKRDSREFVRRKTLMPGTEPLAGEKVWEGGFFEKPSEDVDEANLAGPSQSTPRDDVEVTTVLESMRIDENDRSIDSDHGAFVEDEETDKENTVIPEPEYSSEEEEEEDFDQPTDDLTVTLGFPKGGHDDDDFSMHLDMGGLSMLDIDDPEVGHIERASDADCDIFFSSTDSGSLNSSMTTDSEGVKDSLSSSGASDSAADPFVDSSTLPPTLDSLPHAVESADESDANVADISYASDMDSPVGRGPVVIPVFAVPSPTKTTPMRGLKPQEFDNEIALPATATETVGVSLPSLDSPQSRNPFTQATPLRPVAVPAPASVRLSESTPASQRPMVSSVQSQKLNRVLKSSSVLGSSSTENPKKTAKEEAEATARSKALRTQLEAAFTSKVSSAPSVSSLGASSKAVSASTSRPPSRMADSTRTSKPKSRSDVPPVRKEPTRPILSAPKRLVDGRPVQRPAPATKPAPSKPGPPAIPSYRASTASSISSAKPGIPRPVAKRPMAPPVQPSRPLGATKLTRPVERSKLPDAEVATVVPLKRPVPLHAALSRSLVAVGGGGPSRPMPSRLVRESPAASAATRLVRESPASRPMFSTGGLSGFTGGPSTASFPAAPQPAFQSALSQPAFRSPIRPATAQAKRPFGDGPSRVGATPTPQRMLSTVPEESKPVDNDGSEAVEVVSQPESQTQGAARQEGTEQPGDDAATSQPLSSESSQNGTTLSASPPTSTSSEAVSAELPSEPAARPAESGKQEETRQPSVEAKASSPPPPPTNSESEPPETTDPPADEPGRRSRRVPRPRTVPVVAIAAPKPRPPPAVVPSIAPGMSEKELKAATTRNTMRNQVYYCSIDRQIVRVPGPRPPSPGAKIRTAAEREEADRKIRREQRARRRNRGDDESSEEEGTPLVERVPHQPRAPGDEEDYTTPARPRKRLRVSDDEAEDTSSASSGDSRQVRWDKGLTVIRGALGEFGGPSKSASTTPKPSSLKQAAQIPLDPHGNWAERHRHVDRTKPTKVVVTAVFYDGEEPVTLPSAGTRSKKK